MEKFKKNDLVVVIDSGKAYLDDGELVRDAKKVDKTIRLSKWDKGRSPANNVVYKIRCAFEYEKKAIIEGLNGSLYVIGFDGIKKILKKNDNVICEACGQTFGAKVKKISQYHLGDVFATRREPILVESKAWFSWMHNGDGTIEEGHGWYIPFEDVRYYDIEEEKETPEQVPQIVDDVHSEQLKELTDTIINQTKTIQELTKEISNKERIQDLLNEAVIEKAKDIAVEDMENHLKENLDKFIEKKYGVLPKQIEIVRDDTRKELSGIFHKEFENICRIVNSDIPLMLVGSAGAGKNYTLEQVAEALDLDFYFSNAVNQEYKLTGFIDANGTYHETQFYQAFTKGGMFFLDEIDASCPECLVILNSAIANRYFDFPTGRVKAHENFRVVCAGNTYGTGADMVYVGRNVLDGATLDRFVVLPFDYDEEVEKQLAYDDCLYRFIKALREAINEANLRYIVSMRALINATKLLKIGVDKMSILKTTIIKNMQIDDLNTIVNKVMKTHSSEWTDCLKRMCDNVKDNKKKRKLLKTQEKVQ